MRYFVILFSSLLLAQPAQPSLKAQYQWGYAGPEGQGNGTMSVLVALPSQQVILELHGMGERVLLLSGDGAHGYRLQIPRQAVDLTSRFLSNLPLPFLPQIVDPKGLKDLLETGLDPGVTVTKSDPSGPIKLHYRGKNEHGKEVEVWLTRTRWE